MESLDELNAGIKKINSPKQNKFNLFNLLKIIISTSDDEPMVTRVSKFEEAILEEAEDDNIKRFFETMTLSNFKEYCYPSYSKANKSSEGFPQLCSLIEAKITLPVFSVDNASPFEYLLAAYVLFIPVQNEEISDKISTQKFIQGILDCLKMITSKNAIQEDSVLLCEKVRTGIVHHAQNLFLKSSLPTLEYNQSHDILTVLDTKVALAYLIYSYPQNYICNYSEFAVPITRLLSDQFQPAKDEVPITHEGMEKLRDCIDTSWMNVISLVTRTLNNSDVDELLKKGNLKERIINDLKCALISKNLLLLENTKPKFR